MIFFLSFMNFSLRFIKFFLSFIFLVLLNTVVFSQNMFYADDIVQSKIDSSRYMSAITYIESMEKIDIDTALSLFPKKAFCYYKINKHNEAKVCLNTVESEGVENDLSEILNLYYLLDKKEEAEDLLDRLVFLIESNEEEFFNQISIFNKKDLVKFANTINSYISNFENEEDKYVFYRISSYFYFHAKENANAYNKISSFIDKEPTALSSYLMGLIKMEQHEFISSVSYFNQAEDLGYKSAELFKSRGKAKGFEKDYFGAIEDLNIALQKGNEAEYYFLRGVCYNFVLQYNEALADLNTAIEMCDTIADYYNQRGIVYTNLERHADALFEFQTAIRINPETKFIHNNIGLAYEHNGFIDKAVEHYKISIRKEPYYSDSYFNLGRFYFDRAKYKTAIKYLKEAFLLNPNFGDITHILGLCYIQLDDKTTACNYIQLSIDAGCESAVSTQKEYCEETAIEE